MSLLRIPVAHQSPSMEIVMKYRLLALTGFAAAAVFSSSVFASGSISQPSPPSQPRATTNTQDSLARGKDAYMSKIACDSCPVAGGVQDAQGATALITRIDAGEFNLKRSDKKNVKAYLRNRFNVK
jgi:hypothetical protein